jgi:hypothetical protein
MARDWVEWHRAYADPASELSQRLAAVVDTVRAVFDRAPDGPIRVLSLCCGEARDLCGAAEGHPRAADLVGGAVELSGGLASIAAQQLARAGAPIEVRCADAGRPVHWIDLAPVDLLLLVGIFGNLSDHDVRRTIGAVPAVVRPGGTVVWTRHRRGEDLTPHIRDWFDEVGCSSTALVSPGVESFAVGAERFEGAVSDAEVPAVLFRFLDS